MSSGGNDAAILRGQSFVDCVFNGSGGGSGEEKVLSTGGRDGACSA